MALFPDTRFGKAALGLIAATFATDAFDAFVPSATILEVVVGSAGLIAAFVAALRSESVLVARVADRSVAVRAGVAAAGVASFVFVNLAGDPLRPLGLLTTAALIETFFAAWAGAAAGTLLGLLVAGLSANVVRTFRMRLVLIGLIGCAVALGLGYGAGKLTPNMDEGPESPADPGFKPFPLLPDMPVTKTVFGTEVPRFGVVEIAFMFGGTWTALASLLLLALVPALTAIRRVADDNATHLDRLVQGFQAVGEGDRAVRLKIEGARELAEISAQFNRMVERLGVAEAETTTRLREVEALNAELKRQVAERSRALAEKAEGLGPTSVRELANAEVFADRYQVIRPIGKGGMGAVYEVVRLADGRHFALKVMATDRGHDAARFFREAEIAARLTDPHLVSVVDVGVQTGMLFLVMDLIAGHSLEALRARFGQDAAWGLRVLRDIARGLATLHAHGVVHRDLKPGNVLVPADGPAKIADFGISRLAGASNPIAAGHADTLPPGTPQPLSGDGGHTRTGVLMGTPLYMAPELARGAKDAQPSSDVFAFGLIAYELLTGVRAWDVPPVYEAMAGRALVKPASIHSRAAAVPVALGHMLDSCLATDPGARPDAATLATALKE